MPRQTNDDQSIDFKLAINATNLTEWPDIEKDTVSRSSLFL